MKLYKIKKSKIDKNGLYANCDIKKGTRIIEYKGKIITKKKSEEDSKFDNEKAIYLFNLNKRYDLDGDFIESQAFGFLAARSVLNLPISFPNTTRCSKAVSGGEIIENF